MAGCYDDVQDLLTSVNGPDKHIRIVYVGRPDAMRRSPECYVCECCVSLLEGVRIGEAHHVYSWGNPDEINSDENVCHVWREVPTMPPFLTCLFCPSRMGGLKIIGF